MSQPPHSIALSNSKAKRDAHQKWRRQARERLSAPRRLGQKRPRGRPKKGAPKVLAAMPAMDPARKGSKSLFLM